MAKKAKKNVMKKPINKLKLREKIKIKAREIPALLRAKKEEKKHIVSDKELSQEQHLFEKYALLMKKLIVRKKQMRKK